MQAPTVAHWPLHYTNTDIDTVAEIQKWMAERQYTQAALARLARIGITQDRANEGMLTHAIERSARSKSPAMCSAMALPPPREATRYYHGAIMQEIRCGQCRRKLGAGEFRAYAIKCPRCGTLNQMRTESPQPERPRASSYEDAHAWEAKQRKADSR